MAKKVEQVEDQQQVQFDNQADAATQPEAPKQEAAPQQMVVFTDNAEFRKLALAMPVAERKTFLIKMSEYIGAEQVDSNKFLNVPVVVAGIVIHTATVAGEVVKKLDPNTGEITEAPKMTEVKRTVFKLTDHPGQVLAFVADSISRFAEDYLIPCFGVGDWEEPVTIRITQVNTNSGGRAYSTQVIG